MMNSNRPDVQEIKTRLLASKVIGRYVALKRLNHRWIGLSPFKKEKTPSFYVDDEKGYFHCFSTGKGGDIFTFLMELEGLTFLEALERLATEAGIELKRTSLTSQEQSLNTIRKELYTVMEHANQFFLNNLELPVGKQARDYLKARGIGVNNSAEFQIGYAPKDWDRLIQHLQHACHFDSERIEQAGLSVKSKDSQKTYDRFRERIIFPIYDQQGRCIAFGGRTLLPSQQPKYLNSPETVLFKKSECLYNAHRALPIAREQKKLLIVEGYLDVITLSLAGFPFVVAPLGTALSEAHLLLCWRTVDEPMLCFDGDEAGKKASIRAIHTALPLLSPGKTLRFVDLPENIDPDDYIRSRSKEQFAELLVQSLSNSDQLWSELLSRHRDPIPEQRAALAQDIQTTLNTIQDPLVRQWYRSQFAARLRSLDQPKRAQAKPYTKKTRRGFVDQPDYPYGHFINANQIKNSLKNAQVTSARESFILFVLIKCQELLFEEAERLNALDFLEEDSQIIKRALNEFLAESALDRTVTCLEDFLNKRGYTPCVERLTRRVHKSDRRLTLQRSDEDVSLLRKSLKQSMDLHFKMVTLETELNIAKQAFSAQPNEVNRMMQVTLKEQQLLGIEDESVQDENA